MRSYLYSRHPTRNPASMNLGPCAVFFSIALPALTIAAPPDISLLSDEFTNSSTLVNWTNIKDAESWPQEQLELHDVDITNPGFLTMMPHTCTWYQDYRGPLLFKLIDGDFVATSRVIVSNRANTGAPASNYSLGGILTRAPRSITPGTWTPGGEDYMFLSVGCGTNLGNFQFEVKTTDNSVSTLIVTDTGDGGDVLIQTARIGQSFIQLRKTPGGVWTVHQRYSRADMPSTVQVGCTTYTDYSYAGTWPVVNHNNNTITSQFGNPGNPSQPDLIARFDYMRFVRPSVPPPLVGLDFSDPGQVSDAQLLSFLGANANTPSSVADWSMLID